MLEKLLASISHSGVVQPAVLARQLGVSQALVELMIQDLQRGGYLRTVEGCADGRCRGCAQSTACSTPKIRLWALKEK
jgi:DNA-binding MarR family transcriptional regulator